MKCTLRKVSQGVVAAVVERPKVGDYYYDSYFNNIKQKTKTSVFDVSVFHYKIIASTFGVGKELKVDINGQAFNLPPLQEDEFIEYDYTETETQIIIQL